MPVMNIIRPEEILSYAKCLNSIRSFIVALDSKANIVFINDYGYEILGYERGHLQGKNWFDFIPKDKLRGVQEVFKKIISGQIESLEHCENPIITKSGEIKTILWYNTLLKDSEGNNVGTISSGEDVTTYKKEELLLVENEEKFKKLFESMPNPIMVLDGKGNVVDVNKGVETGIDYQKNELIGKNLSGLNMITTKSKMVVLKNFAAMMAGINVKPYEVKLVKKNGENIIVEVTASIFKNGDEKSIIAVLRDVTEKREAEEKFRNLVDNALVGVYITKINGEFVFANNALADMFEYDSPEDVMKGGVSKLYKNFDDRKYLLDTLKKNGKVSNFEVEYLTKNGKVKNIMISAVLEDEFITGMMMDVTERKKYDDEVQKLASIITHSKELVNLATIDGKMVFLNEFGCDMLGIDADEIEQTNIIQVIPEHLREFVKKEMLPKLISSGGWNGDLQYVNLKNKKITDVHAITYIINDKKTGKPVYLANISEDITDRKNSENELKIKYGQLELLNKGSVSRELKMVELKKKIMELENEIKKIKGV